MVWGNEKMGLAHRVDKHPEVIDKIPEIIEKGKIVTKQAGIHTVVKDNYKIGLSKGFHNKGENHWILTAYEDIRGKDKTFDSTLDTLEKTLSKTSEDLPRNNATEQLKNQELLQTYKELQKKYPNIDETCLYLFIEIIKNIKQS
ncbi:hypothetical protein BKH42_02700 [Helicobacter sp. 13S00482-2]|nr:hypothetical protein BKH42_02700 [Helicobacter sp. 13S00482-2]